MKEINQTKKEILELMWRNENPASLKEISEKTGLKARSVNMHLLGLLKSGYVRKSESGCYTISGSGREALGFPKTDEALAKKVLSKTPSEKAFHFYMEVDQPTGTSSDSLVDFCEKIKTVDVKPIEFHMARGDYEIWVSYLGDIELAKKLRLIRETGLTGQPLVEKLYKVLRSRCDELLQK